MGISSFGYVGGKGIRKTGPIIDSIVAQSTTLPNNGPAIAIEINGSNLAPDAAIKIDDQDISYDLVDATGTSVAAVSGTPVPQKDAHLQVVQKDATAADNKAAAVLRLTITKEKTVENLKSKMQPRTTVAASPLNLTVINSDGQIAVWPLPASLS
jgi:hypothetical protein